ncbi:uncharacterized protein LOC144639855, partial [Oculina patagonica]
MPGEVGLKCEYPDYAQILDRSKDFMSSPQLWKEPGGASTYFCCGKSSFENLSDLIKDKLQESLDQTSLEHHLKVLEALIKHWKGEVLSVSVTRTAEGLSEKDVYRLAALIFETQESVGKVAVELAAPLFRFSAMAGNPDGMYSYGKLLETGEGGVERDPIEAGKLFSELAEQGHPFAQ